MIFGSFHQAEHALLLSLLPTPSLSPTLTILLTQILTPTLTYLSQTLLSVVQALKKEPLPWKAYTIYEALDNVSVKWDEFVRVAGLSGNAVMKGVVREVLGSGTGLKGLCLRSLPEAVEGAKVSERMALGGGKRERDGADSFAPLLVADPDRPNAATRRTSFGCCLDQHNCCTSSLPSRLDLLLVPFALALLAHRPHSFSPLSQTVAYLLKLPEHQETIENFLTQLGDRKWLMGGTATASKGDDDGESGVLEHFVFDVVAALIGGLEARGKGMRKGVGAIFLVNNGESILLLLRP